MKTYTLFFNFLLLTTIGLFAQSNMTIQSGGAVTVNGNVSIIPSIPTSGLVAYYPFNGNANDESGNGNHGTVNGATLTTDRFGNSNSAFYFDGQNDNIIQNNQLQVTFTLCAWAKSDGGATMNQVILGDANGSNAQGYVFYYNINHLFFDYGDCIPNNWSYYIYSLSAIDISQWNFLCVTRNSSIQKLYCNGILLESTENPTSSPVCNLLSYTIGGTPSWFFNGKIDDIRIYDHAITDSEILLLYHEGGW